MSAILADRGKRMFPKTGNTSIRQCITIECFVSFLQRKNRIFTVGFFHPLHHIQRIVKNFLASLHKLTILAFLKIRIISILFIKSMIIINEIDRSVRTVFLYFTNHPANTVSIIGIILFIQSNSVISHCNQLAGFRNIESDTLVHNGNQIFGLHTRTRLFGVSIRNLIRRKHNFRICPAISILRCHQKSL